MHAYTYTLMTRRERRTANRAWRRAHRWWRRRESGLSSEQYTTIMSWLAR